MYKSPQHKGFAKNRLELNQQITLVLNIVGKSPVVSPWAQGDMLWLAVYLTSTEKPKD